ncbi:MAG: glycoside hydrolase 100 family protein [Armatimonadota bacterium]
MDAKLQAEVNEAKAAALTILRHNAHGPFYGLPRTAGWGYPEAYTRDWMLSALGVLVSGDEVLIDALRRVFLALAENQTRHGHIPSLAHDPRDVGASDTTPLFLLGLALFRRVTGEADFLEEAAQKALTWMEYQSPGDHVMVGQLPTSDWRDEQWVLGFGLYVNTVVYTYLRLFGQEDRASFLLRLMRHFVISADMRYKYVHAGLLLPGKPYYALWNYKVFSNERFDLLGNSLAIISGIATNNRAKNLVQWIEGECEGLRKRGLLSVDLPPNLFPFIQPGDPDWHTRYEHFNQPGKYHNGGIWPFICGLYVVAVLAAGYQRLAERKLAALTQLVRPAQDKALAFGFNEWLCAPDGTPCGNDWQTWSAALYLYAAACVERKEVIFFQDLLEHPLHIPGKEDERKAS